MTENWKDVTGYEGLYEVSDLGRVRSKERLIPAGIAHGHPQSRHAPSRLLKLLAGGHVNLARHGGRVKRFQVAQLVYEAFKGPLKPGHKVVNIDGDRANNNVRNLRAEKASRSCTSRFVRS